MKQVTCFEYARQQLISLQKEQELWREKDKAYKAYKSLPLWKKLFTTKVEKPHFSCCRDISVYKSRHLHITFRMYFHEAKKELSYCINEDGWGYKYNMNTNTKESLIGSKGMQISQYAETTLDSVIRLLNPLIIE